MLAAGIDSHINVSFRLFGFFILKKLMKSKERQFF